MGSRKTVTLYAKAADDDVWELARLMAAASDLSLSEIVAQALRGHLAPTPELLQRHLSALRARHDAAQEVLRRGVE